MVVYTDHFRRLHRQICTSRSAAAGFFRTAPPGSHLLDHILTAACSERERFMGVISIFFAWLPLNWGYSAAPKSIKQTCEIYEKPKYDPRSHLSMSAAMGSWAV